MEAIEVLRTPWSNCVINKLFYFCFLRIFIRVCNTERTVSTKTVHIWTNTGNATKIRLLIYVGPWYSSLMVDNFIL